MDAATPFKRNGTSLLLGFALALLVVFLIPANNRSVGLSLVRLLYDIQYGEFNIRGQTRGCNMRMIPNVVLPLRNEDERNVRALNDPDWCLLQLAADHRWEVVPPIELFADHPFQSWAAIQLVMRTDNHYHEAEGKHPLMAPERLAKVYAFVAATQNAYPKNGALWLAEAKLHHLVDNWPSVYACLEEAAFRPDWDHQPEAALWLYQYSIELGLSELHATQIADYNYNDCFNTIDWRIRAGFNDAITQSIRSGNEHEIAEYFDLLYQLGKAHWPDRRRQNAFAVFRDYEFGEALAEEPACLPSYSLEDVNDLLAANDEATIFWIWANEQFEPDVFNDFCDGHNRWNSDSAKVRKQWDAIGPESAVRFILARGFSCLAMSGLGLFVLCTGIYISIRRKTSCSPFDTNPHNGVQLVWRRFLLAVPIGVWGLARSLLIVMRPYGHGQRWDFIASDYIEIAALVGVVLLVATVLFTFSRTKAECLALWVASFACCIGLLLLCCYTQHLYVEFKLAELRGPLTAEFFAPTISSWIFSLFR